MKQGTLDMNIQTLASLQTNIHPRAVVSPGSTLYRHQVERHKHLSEWDERYKDHLLEYYIKEDDKKRSLSPSRQVEIQAWQERVSPRSDRNLTNRRSQRHSAPPKKNRQENHRVMSSRSDSRTILSKKTSFTDGGRFVQKNEDFDSLMNHINQMSLHYEAQRKAIHHRLTNGNHASSDASKLNRNNSIDSSRHSAGSERTVSSSKYDGDTSSVGDSYDNDTKHTSARTPSNNLLNCMSIDDIAPSKRHLLTHPIYDNDSDDEIINLRNSLPSRFSSRNPSANRKSSLLSNSAVSRGFNALLNYKDVQENTSVSGLYKLQGFRTRYVDTNRESVNFKKRKAILREHVATSCMEKLRRPTSQLKKSPTPSSTARSSPTREHSSMQTNGHLSPFRNRFTANSDSEDNKGNFLRVIMDDMEEESAAEATSGGDNENEKTSKADTEAQIS